MIRQAVSADLPAVAALINAAYGHYVPILGRKPRPMLDDHAGRIAAGEHYVGEVDNGIEAVITLLSEQPDALHIFNIAVHPAAQGRGWLRMLLAFAEVEAHRRGAGKLTLYTNALMERNRAIYDHLGFTELREEEGNGYRIVFMERALTA